MWSQSLDRWTPSERTVAINIAKCGEAIIADIDAVEGVRASAPLHKHRRRRRPSVLEVVELAIINAHYEVQVACERHEM